MALDQALIKRLAFVRYLYQSGLSQSYGPAPMSCAALLSWHDSVELFLQLASEYLNVGAGQPAFMDYWDLLNKKLGSAEVGQKESMRRLNKARVALKHHGTFPSVLDVKAFRAAVTGFYHDNTSIIFGIAFDEVSLIEFVNPESARKRLTQAEKCIGQGRTLEALDDIAIAYDEMIRDYETRKSGESYRSPFFFGQDLRFHSSFFMGLDTHSGSTERRLAEFVDRVGESVEAMQGAMKVLALGIDYRKYTRFQMLTPHLSHNLGGATKIHRRFKEENKPSIDATRFCFDFVIESALALGAYDYTLDQTGRAHA
jgi:hypothetical protein